ncbi:MAG: GEVED domain-containing protein [Planctomycetota bacterium]
MSFRKVVLVLSAVLLCTGVLMADTGKKPPAVTNPTELTTQGAVGSITDAHTRATKHPFEEPVGVRQGGDTCADAVVVGPGLPINVTGTTVGYTNDYDEVCNYTGSTSPDVVYLFTPAADVVVNMTMCAGNTNYDSKLYVYEGTCPGATYYVCNDDACTSASGQPYVSEILGVSLTGGTDYYIVCDGYGSASGTYFLDIIEDVQIPWACCLAGDCIGDFGQVECESMGGTWFEGETCMSIPPFECPDVPHCPDGSLFSKRPYLPDESWTLGVSDPGFPYVRVDNYSGVQGVICDVHWWGGELTSGLGNCTQVENLFLIEFYADSGGTPDIAGGPVCTYTVSPTRVDTGLRYHTTYQVILYEYSATLLPCCTLTDGWISITGAGDAACRFWWVSTPDGDFSHCGGANLNTLVCGDPASAFDFAFCLTGEYVETYGACCDDATSICTDDVEQLSCLPPLRFAANTLCADLNPPCGLVYGACCVGATCTFGLIGDCDAMGGVYQGDDVPCDPNPCVGACCYDDGTCELLPEADCTGLWLGAYSTCDQCPCIVPCPAGGIAEGEPCGSDTNGGCNMTVPAFEPIVCGVPVCGTAWANTSTRDTDWYEITVAESTIFTLTGEGELGTLGLLIGQIEQTVPGLPGCANVTGYFEVYTIGGECQEVSITTACMPPGTYYFFVGPSSWGDLPCDSNNDYVITLTCETCYIPTGACCMPSGECVPDQTEEQCVGVSGMWMGEGAGCDPNPCTPFYCDAGSNTCDEYIDTVVVGTINNAGTGCGPGGYQDWTAQSTVMAPGVGYAITVLNPVPYTSDHVTVWVDWNQDFVFDTATEQYLLVSDGPGAQFTGTINVPVDATIGSTQMRIRIEWTGSAGPCGNASYGEVEDYTVMVGDYVPTYGACCDDSTGICTEGVEQLDCMAPLRFAADTLCVDLTPPCGTVEYCTPCYSDAPSPDDWITNVTFNTINNNTANEGVPCAYGDYTDISTTVENGATYTMSVSFDGTGGYTQYVTAWFDFDRNGVLETSYQIGSAVITPGTPVTVSANITIPVSALDGATRMRVIERYSTWTTDPCESYIWGEAEDYTVIVGEYVPTYGSCCDDATGLCTDNVEQLDCMAPLRFAADTLCADLTPPCGEPLGACCFPDQSCADLSALDCAAAGGNYMGAGTNCATTSCPPGNDDCADALPICNVDALPWNTTLATHDGDGTCMTSKNIWYCYTATCTTDVLISLCGSSFDTKLAVYNSCDCGTGLPARQIVCNDDSGPGCPGLQSSALVSMVAGNDYLIEVGGYSSNSGSGILTISMFGDFNFDCAIDGDDYAMFLAAFGSCSGDPAYLAAADIDEDGCVGLADYQAWVAAYRACNPGSPLPIPSQDGPSGMNRRPSLGTGMMP